MTGILLQKLHSHAPQCAKPMPHSHGHEFTMTFPSSTVQRSAFPSCTQPWGWAFGPTLRPSLQLLKWAWQRPPPKRQIHQSINPKQRSLLSWRNLLPLSGETSPDPRQDPENRFPHSRLQYSYGVDYGTIRWIYILDPPRGLGSFQQASEAKSPSAVEGCAWPRLPVAAPGLPVHVPGALDSVLGLGVLCKKLMLYQVYGV